ncbi:MAG TPA: hypothetical protein EYF98_07425 [Planctomycetes bacterium]|nr:hypothetical protein [Planctomycetota bacterium]
MTNRQVIAAWRQGKPGSAGSLRTDGSTLWSYNLIIGKTKEGGKVALDYRTASGHFRSSTTSTHVGRAAEVADRLEVPA